MVEENKRLVEVECILRKLDADYINKIPKEIWDYIEKNKDKEYLFNYDENKNLNEQNLSIDTISILTYINIKYLLDEQHKKEMLKILREDMAFAEQEKAKLYTTNEFFKDKQNNKQQGKQETMLIEIKEEKWYKKVFTCIKEWLRK